MPFALAQKFENAALIDARRRADHELCRALRAQPGPTIANLLAFGGGVIGLVLAGFATLLAAMMGFVMDDPSAVPHWGGVGLIECGLGLGLVAFVQGTLANRTALSVLTLGFSALPPERAGASEACRNCGAPLPELAPGDALSRCVYCDADNLRSVDLRFDADVVRRFSAGELSSTPALERMRARRRRARVLGLVSVLLIGAGAVWQLVSAST